MALPLNIDQRYYGAIAGAICSMLDEAGFGAMAAGAQAFKTPGGQKIGALTVAAGGVLLFAQQLGCRATAGGKGPTGENFCQVNTSNVCVDFEAGEGQLLQLYDGEQLPIGFNYRTLLSITCDTDNDDTPDSKGYLSSYRDIEYIRIDGTLEKSRSILYYKPGSVPLLSSRPVTNDDPAIPDGQCTTRPRFSPVETVDGNNCAITVSLKGLAQSPGGNVSPIVLVEGGHQKQKWIDEKQWEDPQRGNINPAQPVELNQTCDIQSTLGITNINGENVYVPYNDNENLDDNIKRLMDEISDRFNDVDDQLGDLDDKLDDILEDLEDIEPGPPLMINGGKVTFNAVCDKDEDGNLEKVEYPLKAATSQNEALIAIYDNQTTIMTMLQQHLLWKTPICPPEKPELKGDFVTVRFESDSKSPNGERPLRKLLRYRSQSTRDLGQLTDYWKSFTWRSGPVCVFHKGSPVGTPQVWASTADEGKRVLRHAFGEAGVDPDQIGEWGVSGSDNPRYGVSLTVRVQSIDGGHWVTSREGPDGLPLLAVDP